LVWLGVPLLATQATYQAGGVCPNLFVYIVKIYSHFLLAKLAIPTATRDSSDSMPGKQAENILRLASNSGDHATSKARRGIANGYILDQITSTKAKRK